MLLFSIKVYKTELDNYLHMIKNGNDGTYKSMIDKASIEYFLRSTAYIYSIKITYISYT